jgi:thiol:disulfide interchange protein DsbC
MSNIFSARRVANALTVAVGLAFGLSAHAAPSQNGAGLGVAASSPMKDHSSPQETIRRVFKQRYPTLAAISAVNRTPFPGVYEVVFGTQIVYSDATGEFMFDGPLMATSGNRNLTQEHLDSINAEAWPSLPFDDAIVVKNGTGARKMVVFADPNCGYCKRLQKETIPKLKDVTVYTFIIPILAPDSETKAKEVLCSKDPAATWNAWMADGVALPPAPSTCEPKVIDHGGQRAERRGPRADAGCGPEGRALTARS